MIKEASFLEDALPRLDPIIAVESGEHGWRGLTADGEVLEVRGGKVPDGDVVLMHAGKPVGRRALEPRNDISINSYLKHYDWARELHQANFVEQALAEADRTVLIAPTLRARFNRSQILLATGRWEEGFAEQAACEREPPFQRPRTAEAIAMGIPPWQGEPIAGKRLLLLHDHGFGDTIMCLRYVSRLWDMGADVTMLMPPELRKIARQCAPVVDGISSNADYFCTMLGLLSALKVTPESVAADDAPYLAAEGMEVWRYGRRARERRRIGITWSVGKFVDGEYPREVPLELLVERFGRDAELVSLQVQGGDRAAALGVRRIDFDDFEELAALMLSLDQVVSVDTAALHLAGAIGHPDVVGLLSHWHSWRWRAPWYDVRFVRQAAPGDWASALEQVP